MITRTPQTRYLISAEPGNIPELRCQLLVIGSGIAGLSAALAAARQCARVILCTKDDLSETSTNYAQGGIAAALAEEDSIDQHVSDTLIAGQGLCEEDAVLVLARDGIERVNELIAEGLPFDRLEGELHFTMEGAHSIRRILHGDGDATGRVLQDFLGRQVRANPHITILEKHFTVDLLHADGVCHGAVLLDTSYGRMLCVRSTATVLATGGAGQIFRETTNPACATGDGFALAFRAGAELRDMEFVQFHPTTLYLAGAPRFLISESVRGEGARLINQDGENFMERYDERGCLAPRDVVSQSIFRELNRRDGSNNVFLDLRHLDEELISVRFPNISRICSMYGLDIANDLIPVRPAAHYFMGGILTDMDGKTNVERLYAAGECASTGVHGANRLASNSLLEGLVFGHRAGIAALEISGDSATRRPGLQRTSRPSPAPLDLNDMLQSLKALTWRNVGVFRNREKMEETIRTIGFWERYVLSEEFSGRGGFEIQNMLTVAKVVVNSALLRKESRGAHQRSDFPQEAPTVQHTVLSIEDFTSEGE